MTWTVDDDGPADFSTIQAAIDAASPDDAIFVSDGTYNENLTVNKADLYLKSVNGAAATTINGAALGTVVDITASKVRVTGFTITGSKVIAVGENVFTDCGMTLTGVTNCIILDNTVNYAGGIGIKLQGADGNTIQGNSIAGSSIAGIALFGSSNNIVKNNSATGAIQSTS
ncbi:unnamed protein product, partial [marine sediment metagenome]